MSTKDEDYQVWTCKIVIKARVDEMPRGFDYPPRFAAEKAISDAGFEVLMNSSGWGGSLNEFDRLALAQDRRDIYVVGKADQAEH